MPRPAAATGLYLLALLVCTGPARAEWSAEAGTLFTRSFTPRVYQASPQNWATVQDKRGVMFFGNTGGVLEYDGVSWRRISVGSGSARSLAVDDSGTVFVGSQGEFGYLAPDAHGDLHYVSLLERVPADARKFADIWSILPFDDAVYFGSYQAIFRWSPRQKTIRVWKPVKAFGRLTLANGVFYAASLGQGLLRLRGENWEPVPGGETFAPPDVRAVYTGRSGLELATRTALYRYENATFKKISASADQLLKDGSISAVKSLEDGTRLIATARGGLVIMNPDDSAVRTYTRAQGLLSDSLTGLFRDREGGLWITSNSGIERIDLAATRFTRTEGLNGNVYSIARHQGRLYAATGVGLFVLRTGASPRFEGVPGLNLQTPVVMPSAHGLLAGAQRGLYWVEENTASLIYETDGIYDLALSARDLNTIYAVGRGGLYKMNWTGSGWEMSRKLPASGQEFRSVAEDSDGRIWVTTPKGILRIDWRTPEQTPAQAPAKLVETFGPDRGVPDGFKNLFRLGGRVVFATAKGLLQYSEADSRFLPWPGFAPQPVSIVREAANGALWITGEGYHGILQPASAGKRQWQPMPLMLSDATELYAVQPEADGTVWAAGAEGFLIRYSPGMVPPAPAFGVELRLAQTHAGLTAFGGAGTLLAEPRLRYRENTLRFEYAAPFLEDPAKVEYQVRLDGADSEWSKWSGESHRDYTHLFEGSYRFLVRARNPHGVVSEERAFPFTILAPWYRAWWAWLAYGICALGGVWGFVRWRVRKLEQEKEQLEVIVADRTVEIRQQRDQIQVEEQRSQALLLNILPASVAEELKTTGTVQPQYYEEVTVCFTDFVGFTLSSENMPADALVSSLHEYFTNFDEIVEEFDLEKLKTIGDSYMLVSGLPRPRASHAVDAVLAALKMVEVVAELAKRGEGAAWGVRIGLHSGPVSAGVVGVRKFAFDIWGNTVNLASRMESSSVPGSVNISSRTQEMVADFFECEARGLVQTKDKREREMYFVHRLRPELEDPEAFRNLYQGRFGREPSYAG